MDIYVDVLNKIAVTGAMDATPAVRPDIRSPTTYTVNLYFLQERRVWRFHLYPVSDCRNNIQRAI